MHAARHSHFVDRALCLHAVQCPKQVKQVPCAEQIAAPPQPPALQCAHLLRAWLQPAAAAAAAAAPAAAMRGVLAERMAARKAVGKAGKIRGGVGRQRQGLSLAVVLLQPPLSLLHRPWRACAHKLCTPKGHAGGWLGRGRCDGGWCPGPACRPAVAVAAAALICRRLLLHLQPGKVKASCLRPPLTPTQATEGQLLPLLFGYVFELSA